MKFMLIAAAAYMVGGICAMMGVAGVSAWIWVPINTVAVFTVMYIGRKADSARQEQKP